MLQARQETLDQKQVSLTYSKRKGRKGRGSGRSGVEIEEQR